MQNYQNVHIFHHPLIDHKITHLCDKNTSTKEFRETVSELAMLMGYEAFGNLKTKMVKIDGPISSFESPIIDEKIAIVPILRAGLGMVDGLLSLFPNARVGHIGLYRNEETLEPVEYYCKLPKDCLDGQVIVVDPALATGGSASAAIQMIKDRGYKRIMLLSLIGAPCGIEKVATDHPDVQIYVAHFHPADLDKNGYMPEAFGDAGDRIFGTK